MFLIANCPSPAKDEICYRSISYQFHEHSRLKTDDLSYVRPHWRKYGLNLPHFGPICKYELTNCLYMQNLHGCSVKRALHIFEAKEYKCGKGQG